MIDDANEVDDLIESLNDHLPMSVRATPMLVKSIGKKSKIKVNDDLRVDSVVYLHDNGGIACGIVSPRGKDVFIVSITHLRIDDDHPLAERIQKYQFRRSRTLQAADDELPQAAPIGSATKVKGQAVGETATSALKKVELRRLLKSAHGNWLSGEYRQAADAFRQAMNLDEEDFDYSHYWLASCLFHLDSFDELDQLLDEFHDGSGTWRFAQALEAFRRHGDNEESQRLLVQADHLEPVFEQYLLRDKMVDASRRVKFDSGQADRAFGSRLFLPAWRNVPGAVSWARRVLKAPPTSIGSSDVSRRFPHAELRALPLRSETWQIGLLSDNKSEDTIWLLGVANPSGQEIRVATVIDQPLTENLVWNAMLEAFLAPLDGTPARPAVLVVCRNDFHNAWKPLLAQIGVQCQYENSPQPVSQLLEGMQDLIEKQELIDKQELPDTGGVDLTGLPQSDAVWQADFFRSPAWVMNDQDGAYRPWSVLVLEKPKLKALTTSHSPGDPTPEILLDVLTRTMSGKSQQRPGLIEVADSDCYDYLQPRLKAAGIECRLVDQLTEFNDFCLQLADGIDGSEKCALADGRGVTRDQMESFYEAAASYFRKAPWRHVPGEIPIEVRCADPKMGTRYAIVLGRTGVQLGLCVYDNRQIMQSVLSGNALPEQNKALAVCYDEPMIMAAVDLMLIERLGWPIATPEAWPALMRLEPYRTPRSATAAELTFMDACLRGIPDFIQSKAALQTVRVETGTRPVELQLAWER